MTKAPRFWLLVAAASWLLLAQAAAAVDGRTGNLVSVRWLEQHLTSEDVVLLDASPPPMYAAKHIPGAVSVDVFNYGGHEVPIGDMERRFQSWGLSAGKKVVIYDQGASFMATRLFFDLYSHGFPVEDLLVLDGGLSKWQEIGGAVTKDPAPPVRPGSFRITQIREDARVRLPEFLVASGDPKNSRLIDALEPSYYFGETKFFDRAGHIPNAVMMPSADFFNPDKTFKAAEEIERMAAYLGVRREQQIHTYCGGGIAATVPFFALKFILDYPKVSVYRESQLEWLRDERGLPLWTYEAPFLLREMNWLNAWGSRMMRTYDVSQLSVIDVRPPQAYGLGHVPYALNIPADVFRAHLHHPEKLAEMLGLAGVNAAHEAVIVSEGGLNPRSALSFVVLEKLGQAKVSVLTDSVDEWGLRGFPLTKEATVVGRKRSPQELAVPATTYLPKLRPDIVTQDLRGVAGRYPQVFLDSGKQRSSRPQAGKVIHVPHSELVNGDGTPKAAKDLWNILTKAGIPRYAQIICFSDDPGEAAVNYFILKLMGYPDVKVLLT